MRLSDGQVWFVFGAYPDGQHVDIANATNMAVLERVPTALAEAICTAHNLAVQHMEAHAILRERGPHG